MMASSPEDRYANADDLIRDFMLIAGHMGLRGINPEGLVCATSAESGQQNFWQKHLGWMVSVAALILVVLFLERFPGIEEQQPETNSSRQQSGVNSRKISANTRCFSGERFTTQFDITQSTESASTGKSSMRPLRTSTFFRPEASMFFRARSIISSVISIPMTWPAGPTFFAASRMSIPAPDPRSSTTSPSEISLKASGFPHPNELSTASAGRSESSSPR